MDETLLVIILSSAALVLVIVALVFIIIQPLAAFAIPPVLWAIAAIVSAIRGRRRDDEKINPRGPKTR
jgi:type IV secretory pathway VirB3-like protein